MTRLMKKTVLITGASSGIGKACAELLAKDYNLILCSRNGDKLIELKDNLSSKNAVHIFKLDVRNYSDIEELFNFLSQESINIDVLINSAGLALGLETLDKSLKEDISTMLDTNVKGVLFMSKFALGIMKKLNRGHIINLGSIAGINSYPTGITYAATKSAVKSISDGLRKDITPYNIRITNIQPGLVKTAFSVVRFKGNKKEADSVYDGIKPLSAIDIANIIKYTIEVPQHIQINEVTITPTHQATVEHIYKSN